MGEAQAAGGGENYSYDVARPTTYYVLLTAYRGSSPSSAIYSAISPWVVSRAPLL